MIARKPARLIARCILAAALSLSVLSTACERMNTEHWPTPPAEAVPLHGGGSFENRLGQVASDMRRRLQAHGLGQVRIENYRLPAGTDWERIEAHYRDVGAPWQRVDDIPGADSGFAYRWRVWRDGDRAHAIALIDTPTPGERTEMALLLVASPR